MTTREKFEKMMVDRGMFANDAKKIMDIVISEYDANSDYQVTWNRPEYEYPEQIYSILWMVTVRESALKWLNENIPMAWFKVMFE